MTSRPSTWSCPAVLAAALLLLTLAATAVAQGPPPPPPPPPGGVSTVGNAGGGGGGGGRGGGGAGGTGLYNISISSGIPEFNRPPVVPGTGAISGVVSDAATNRPLVNTVVTLRGNVHDTSGATALRSMGQQLTDAKGRFVFTDLPASDNYTITTQRTGYFAGGYGANADNTSGSRIVLADHEWFAKSDVSMSPTAAISGRVLDDHGDPVVGAYVRVLRQIFVGGAPHLAPARPVRTDDRGAYRIAGLDPGKYLVCAPSVQASVPVSASVANVQLIDADPMTRLVVGRYATPPGGSAAMTYPVTCYPERSSLADAMPVDVASGVLRGDVDLQLVAVPAWRIAGRVDGPPDGRAGLTLRLLGAGSEQLGLGSETATAMVASDGTFTFLGIPAGAYVIDARGTMAGYDYSPGVQGGVFQQQLPSPPMRTAGGTSGSSSGLAAGPTRTMFTTTSFGNNNGLWGQAPVIVDGRDVTDVLVTLRPATTLNGRIVFEGAAPPPNGSQWTTVEAADGDPSRSRVRAFAGQTRDAFTVEGLVPGSYVVRVSPPNAWAVKSIVINARDYTHIPFDISGVQPINDVTVTLTDQAITLNGHVRDAEGRAVTSAAVILFPVDRAGWRNYGQTPDRIKTTNVSNAGDYRLAGIPAGEYCLIAVEESQTKAWQNPAFLEAASRLATRLALGWGETKSADLTLVAVR